MFPLKDDLFDQYQAIFIQDQSTKMRHQEPAKSPNDINRQMLEIKKKIQLSEGQRKAVFEDCEAEKKTNSEEIQKLKTEITQLISQLNETRKATTTLKIFSKRLESLIGPFDEKPTDEIEQLIDLQIIDKTKAFDLLQYKYKKRQSYLEQLGKEYQILLSEKNRKEVIEKVDRPIKKATCDLQNSIHAVEVQLREAHHISVRYRDIRKSLQEDGARFESTIRQIEDELHAQNQEINKLQQVMNEATRMRGSARSHLLKEEKVAMATANSRERQTVEGRRLVGNRRQELEMLEKRIFQSGKTPMRAEAEDNAHNTDDEAPDTPSQPGDALTDAFDVLKQATGATNSEEVLKRFSTQKDTFERLVMLRKKSEMEKRQLEKQLEMFNNKLEHYKYVEVKEAERKSSKMEQVQSLIEEQQQRSKTYIASKQLKEKSLETILQSLKDLHLAIDPMAIPTDDILKVLQLIEEGLRKMLEKTQEVAEEPHVVLVDGIEEKWLPQPYSGLVRRTPLPQPGASPAPPPPPGSEDEEEVPSRAYLKRQAQLVVDAKSRRKNIRIQLNKRN